MATKNSSGGGKSWIMYMVVFDLIGILLLAVYIYHLSHAVIGLAQGQVSQSMINNVNYKCDDGKTISAVYFDSKVELSLSDKRNLLLMQAISGSGVRYTNNDESTTFWNKGNTAFIEEGALNRVTFANCVQTTSQ